MGQAWGTGSRLERRDRDGTRVKDQRAGGYSAVRKQSIFNNRGQSVDLAKKGFV